jgi:type II secretory pathway pseudopilin PulG
MENQKTEFPNRINRSKKPSRIALAVVGLLAVVVVGGILLQPCREFIEREKIKRAQLGLKKLEGAIDSYVKLNGVYPEESLECLCKTPNNNAAALLDKGDLLDPWGQRYRFNSANPPAGVIVIANRLYSFGPPGLEKPIRLARQ